MDPRLEHFAADTVERFRFLVDEFGFSGPDDVEEGYVGYSLPPLAIWVVLEPHNKTVDTFVTYADGTREVTAPLTQLVVAAGKGGSQRAGGSAQTRRAMVRSLSLQAQVLREILGLLSADGGYELIEQVAE